MPRRFFTSDLHIGHKKIIEFVDRPFEFLDMMHEVLIDNWNEVVSTDDIVFVLGDWAMGKISDTLPMTAKFNGRKILIPGNHDRCSDAYKGGSKAKWIPEYIKAGFVDVWPEKTTLMLASRHIVNISHFPYDLDERHLDKFQPFQPIDDGRWLLHGHVHEMWAEQGRQINVGVDVRNFYPISEDEIISITQGAS